MNLQTFLQAKAKAVTAYILTQAGSLIAFYQVNQTLTLKDLVMSVVVSVVTTAGVHTVPNKK